MKQIIMLEDCQGSPDGVSVMTYEKGKIYDLPDDLANTFLMMGVAEKSNDGFGDVKIPESGIKEPETPEKQKKTKSDKMSENR